jgi:hypothetical protein
MTTTTMASTDKFGKRGSQPWETPDYVESGLAHLTELDANQQEGRGSFGEGDDRSFLTGSLIAPLRNTRIVLYMSQKGIKLRVMNLVQFESGAVVVSLRKSVTMSRAHRRSANTK